MRDGGTSSMKEIIVPSRHDSCMEARGAGRP